MYKYSYVIYNFLSNIIKNFICFIDRGLVNFSYKVLYNVIVETRHKHKYLTLKLKVEMPVS
jgi:hypothetical protein